MIKEKSFRRVTKALSRRHDYGCFNYRHLARALVATSKFLDLAYKLRNNKFPVYEVRQDATYTGDGMTTFGYIPEGLIYTGEKSLSVLNGIVSSERFKEYGFEFAEDSRIKGDQLVADEPESGGKIHIINAFPSPILFEWFRRKQDSLDSHFEYTSPVWLI